ncbi:DUF7282 domain-containing protein [Halovenus halobia]|uniref:DUF7282 domain-containing protein n=1 Tax=Halovenus halobia TaxID=3396622 RepID=UPI003F572A18
MSQDPVDSPQRRRLLAGLGTGVVAYGAGVSATAAQSDEFDEISVRLNNIATNAWEVTEASDDEFAETGVGNPELTFRVGSRYTIQNNGWSAHPLEFRDSDGDPLLSQSAQGSYEGDSETNWVDNETSVSFTVTSELAAELSSYICTVHSSMEGTIRTIDQTGTDGPADVTMSDQSTDGTSVVVDSVRLDEGGFVTIHDSSLTNGATLESVRGTSEYLEVGSVQDLEVELDDPLTSGDTLIAMAHRDSNDNETYDFVSSGGNADGPYSFDGNAVIDDADVQINTSAAVKIDDQQSDGTSVTVDFARLDDGGFVTIHDSTLLDGDALGSVRGTSQYFDSGTQEEFTVELDEALTETETVIAMPHRDTNGNQTYDFVSSEANNDGPYTDDDGAITDSAEVQVGDAVEASVTFPRQATASPTFTQDEATSPGVSVAVSSNVESAVVVTYEDGENLVIAGLGVFGADELGGENPVTIAVEDAGGFPGSHTAHAIPTSDLSGEYAPGDTVSMDTAGAVADNDTAVVHQATLTFEDQTSDSPVESGDTVATVDSSLTGDVTYTVDVHVTDDEGGLVAAEWIGSTNVLSGDNEGSEIIAERTPSDGEFNELPFSGTDTFVAMIHLATDASAGDAATPGTGPVVPNIDGESGAVPGGITATAELTAEMDDGGDDGGMDGGDDGGMDGGSDDGDSGGSDDGSSDDGGPGFGPIAGVAGLGGLATYAYRKLNLDSEPATPEDDGLDEDDE